MYLAQLNEKEKNLFLDVGIHLASADNSFSENEKMSIDLLCDEMNIASRYTPDSDLKDALDYVEKNSGKKVQRIFVFELLGIALADTVFAGVEKDMIFNIAKQFNIDTDELDKVVVMIRNLYDIYKEVNNFIEK